MFVGFMFSWKYNKVCNILIDFQYNMKHISNLVFCCFFLKLIVFNCMYRDNVLSITYFHLRFLYYFMFPICFQHIIINKSWNECVSLIYIFVHYSLYETNVCLISLLIDMLLLWQLIFLTSHMKITKCSQAQDMHLFFIHF